MRPDVDVASWQCADLKVGKLEIYSFGTNFHVFFLFVYFCDEAAMKVIVLSYYDGIVHKDECKYGFME